MCSAWTRDRLEWYHLENRSLSQQAGSERPFIARRADWSDPGEAPEGVGVSLSALVSVGLRHRVSEPHLELVAAQRHLPVVADEPVEALEHQVVRQVEAGGARVLTGVDPAMLDPTGTPAGRI